MPTRNRYAGLFSWRFTVHKSPSRSDVRCWQWFNVDPDHLDDDIVQVSLMKQEIPGRKWTCHNMSHRSTLVQFGKVHMPVGQDPVPALNIALMNKLFFLLRCSELPMRLSKLTLPPYPYNNHQYTNYRTVRQCHPQILAMFCCLVKQSFATVVLLEPFGIAIEQSFRTTKEEKRKQPTITSININIW